MYNLLLIYNRFSYQPTLKSEIYKCPCFLKILFLDLCFQVITGGHYDVDCRLEDPDGIVLYKEMKKQYDSFTFTASRNGTYKFCFSNEFSTFTHKTVYFDFQVGEDPPLFPSENRVTALTQVKRCVLQNLIFTSTVSHLQCNALK
uniref:GOLD domain-containing protein n=1 Tax=Cyanistes caeruleus TaxID=156563 RepID=A0A8C0UQA6_CYACU